jgi:hypothetical protein
VLPERGFRELAVVLLIGGFCGGLGVRLDVGLGSGFAAFFIEPPGSGIVQ